MVLLVGGRVFLWSLLFLIPGLIAAFRYSQAFYIMADHPEYSAGECIRQSKGMMRGNKGKLFIFELTFMGWALLANLPMALMPTMSGLVLIVVDFVVSIPFFFFLAYMTTGRTVFYELVSQNLMARPTEEPYQGIPKSEYDA